MYRQTDRQASEKPKIVTEKMESGQTSIVTGIRTEEKTRKGDVVSEQGDE